jgi:hypothetical protein
MMDLGIFISLGISIINNTKKRDGGGGGGGSIHATLFKEHRQSKIFITHQICNGAGMERSLSFKLWIIFIIFSVL